jgi:hypothetical protein
MVAYYSQYDQIIILVWSRKGNTQTFSKSIRFEDTIPTQIAVPLPRAAQVAQSGLW